MSAFVTKPDAAAGGLRDSALVTGGSTGIGRETCLALAERGVRKIAVGWFGNTESDAMELVAELKQCGVHAIACNVDVTDLISVSFCVTQMVAEFGGLGHLVNAAGTTRLVPFGDLDALTPDIWELVYKTNAVGAFNMVKAAAEVLKESAGSVVNVASISAYRAVGSSIAYGSTKAGVVQMTRGLASALAPYVRVNSVSPGTTRSAWLIGLVGEAEAERQWSTEAPHIPLGRVCTPTDIAKTIVALLELPMVTGVDVIVDGGKHILY
jgi:NAD(P)-dependent dehydrogenase (short-subunit alcohol dehydrogenase family)